MRSVHKVVLSSFLLFFTGCAGGVKFNDSYLNTKLSPEMLGTSVFKDTEILKRHLEEIPGYIVVDDGSGSLQAVAPLMVAGYVPPVTPIKDSASFYHSIIDQTAGVQGSYLAILSADLDATHTAEVTITETAEAFIPGDKVPWQEIVKWAKANPVQPKQKRYYIQGALLANVTKSVAVEVKSDATVDASAYGAKGKVYATDKNSQSSNTAYIGTHLLDVDLIANNSPSLGLTKGDYGLKKGLIFERFSVQ